MLFRSEARRLGTGSAIAVVMTVVILVISAVLVRLGERGDEGAVR